MSGAIHTHCDIAQARAGADGPAVAHPWAVLATTILASSLAFIDGSVVNVGLPAIARDLGAGASDLQWVVNAYLLPLSALLLFGGAAGDRFGRRRLLVFGVGVFVAASAACAFSPSLPWLITSRVLQGAGAAMLMPNSLAILGGAYQGEARGRAIGTWAAVGAMAGAVGPVLGGWLIDTTGWRAIFLLNLPLGLAAIGLAVMFVRDAAPGPKRPPLDLPGVAVAAAALGSLTWGLTVGSGPGGWTAPSAASAIAGALLMVAFVWIERRRGDRAMMPLSLFGSRSFAGLTLLTLLLYGALGGMLVLLPYVLIQTAGYSATAAGAALLPFPVVIALSSSAMGALAGRIGARMLLTIGPLGVGAGFLLALRITGDGDYWTTVLPCVLVMSLGMACAVAPLTTAVLASVDAQHSGSASGFNSAIARTGGLVATALLGGVLSAEASQLLAPFRTAAVVGAGVCLAASLSALTLISARPRPE